MKKLTIWILLLALLVGMLSGCAAKEGAAEPTATPETTATAAPETTTTAAPETTTAAETKAPAELVVFAAASMTETLNELAEKYKSVAPDVTLTFNFDSSGTLKTQIEQGADCDVFISAGQKQMNQLDITADKAVNTDGLDFVLANSRVNLLENKIALCVPKGNPKKITSFDDLAKHLQAGDILMAMGNADVPVGQYTQKILSYYKLDEKKLADAGVLTYGTNVKEVTTQITEGTVDCGVIYQTDAYSAGLKPVATATKEMCGQVIYPAAVMKASKHSDEAKAFLQFLQTDDAKAVFEKVGFTALK